VDLTSRNIIRGEVLYVRKPFRFGGVTYTAKAKFEYLQLSMSWRSILKLREAGYLITEEEYQKAFVKPLKKSKPPKSRVVSPDTKIIEADVVVASAGDKSVELEEHGLDDISAEAIDG